MVQDKGDCEIRQFGEIYYALAVLKITVQTPSDWPPAEPCLPFTNGHLDPSTHLDDVWCPTFEKYRLNIQTIPPGPYIAQRQKSHLHIYEAWRLYPDTNDAFMCGVTCTSHGIFRQLVFTFPDGSKAVTVPSRLYDKPTAERPLAGMRTTIKDIIDMNGLKTSQGCKAWLELYPAASANAHVVDRLLALGTVIVAKTRTSQLAHGQYGDADYVDYATPINPRGDSQQDPSSSSSGAGVAAAAYDWLDLHVGTDTGGSVRAPAAVNGVYGIRPSHGSVSLQGVLPVCMVEYASAELDTIGLLSGKIDCLTRVSRALFSLSNEVRMPTRLICPFEAETSPHRAGLFPPANNAAHIYDQFLYRLEEHLGLKADTLNFHMAHERVLGESPIAFMGEAWTAMTCYDQWNSIGRPFQAQYQQAFNKQPALDPPVRRNFEYAQTVTSKQRQKWSERRELFAAWIQGSVLRSSTDIIVFPLQQGAPCDRRGSGQISPQFFGWNRYSISQMAGLPEIALTIGQVAFDSQYTADEVSLPISVSLVAAKGQDQILLDLVEALVAEGIVQAVSIGTRHTFAEERTPRQ